MKASRKKFFSIISVVLIFTLMITVNAGAALAAPQENASIPDQNYYEENGVKVEIVHKSLENVVIHVDDANSGENYSMDIHQSNDGSYYSKTVDENGTLLNTIVKVNDELIQYDTNGNILSRNTIPKTQDITTISPFAGTWQDKMYIQSSISTYLSNQVNVASAIISAVCATLNVGGLIAGAIGAIQFIANDMITNRIPTTYYKGWKQYGWEYAYYMVRYNLDFYKYSNYTGYIKNVSATQGVH